MKRQRHQYRAKQERKHSTLTPERQRLLEELGFVWDSHASGWEERLKELQDFKDKHGHCRVPKTYADNPQLAIWVKVSWHDERWIVPVMMAHLLCFFPFFSGLSRWLRLREWCLDEVYCNCYWLWIWHMSFFHLISISANAASSSSTVRAKTPIWRTNGFTSSSNLVLSLLLGNKKKAFLHFDELAVVESKCIEMLQFHDFRISSIPSSILVGSFSWPHHQITFLLFLVSFLLLPARSLFILLVQAVPLTARLSRCPRAGSWLHGGCGQVFFEEK